MCRRASFVSADDLRAAPAPLRLRRPFGRLLRCANSPQGCWQVVGSNPTGGSSLKCKREAASRLPPVRRSTLKLFPRHTERHPQSFFGLNGPCLCAALDERIKERGRRRGLDGIQGGSSFTFHGVLPKDAIRLRACLETQSKPDSERRASDVRRHSCGYAAGRATKQRETRRPKQATSRFPNRL
jgi:hypothetical protein